MTQIIAHRGASLAHKQNTVAAYRAAVAMGADMIEIDVRRSADGELVIHHDPAISDGRAICDLVASDIPADLPNLHDALIACEGAPVNVEVKNAPEEDGYDPTDGLARQVAAALASFDAERGASPRRWLISSFNFDTAQAVAAAYPGVRTAFIVKEVEREQFERCARFGFTGINAKDRYVTKEVIDEAHRMGLALGSWTVNGAERMRTLFDWGIDQIFTDAPDLALSVRGRRD